MNFDHIFLESEQDILLIALVEASRRQPRDQRQKFLFVQSITDSTILGLDDYPNPYIGDVEALARVGLLNLSYGSKGTPNFDVTPLGFRYYEHLMQSRGQAAERIEENVLRYLEFSGFEKRHPDAFAKWRQAEELLWASDSQSQHTTIGHLCREAMQFFATSLVEVTNPANVTGDITKTKNRMKAAVDQVRPNLSTKIAGLVDSMVGYWDALDGLVQRQEHGAQKEGETLTWKDSRLLVFHTVLVMTEIDRALHNS